MTSQNDELRQIVTDSEKRTKDMILAGLEVMIQQIRIKYPANAINLRSYCELLDIGKSLGVNVSNYENQLRSYLGLMEKPK